ncbi:MAG: ABC transporter substrate-binding protein [Anaerolineae bacterium]|nr:ABC transporter substrate-binding protein [Anaerolineae bacterium]
MSESKLSRRDFLKVTASGVVAAIAAKVVPAAAAPARQGPYNESPMLADLVASGELPPVEERLPTNPRVITPLNEVGEYGGTWRRAFKGVSDRWGPTKLNEEMAIEWDAPDPDTTNLAPNFISEWTQNADATEFTFTLRDGLKWSDGAPMTTEDVQFYYDEIFLTQLLNKPDFYIVNNVDMQLEVIDTLTWKVTFAAPNPLLPIRIAKSTGGMTGGPTMMAPKHYLSQYLPHLTDDPTLIDAAMAANGKTTWQELHYESAPGDGRGVINFWYFNPELPIVNAWKAENTPLEDPYGMVRNPYYHAVDTEGNQLPYVDRISHALFEDNQTLNLWIAQGLIDMQQRHLSTADFTFFKENEGAGDYKVVLWKAALTHAFHPNVSTPDPVLAGLFDTAEFREALSIAIDRNEINDLVYNGMLEPRQASPVSGSPEFDPDFETRWIEYDPDRANQLLDDLGLTERDGEGFRLRPDGETLAFRITYTDVLGSITPDEIQLVEDYWRAIGLKASTEVVERSLYEERVRSGDVEVGVWFVDRSSVVIADPTRYLGTVNDGPWAVLYAHWEAAQRTPDPSTYAFPNVEPPAGHPVREIWSLWDQARVEPDEASRKALFKQLLDIHKAHPYMIGTVGEDPQPVIVKNNFFNVGEGFISDDTLRNVGLLRPVQFFMRQA